MPGAPRGQVVGRERLCERPVGLAALLGPGGVIGGRAQQWVAKLDPPRSDLDQALGLRRLQILRREINRGQRWSNLVHRALARSHNQQGAGGADR